MKTLRLVRFAFVLFGIAPLASCRDYPLTPNTDVGLRVWAEVSPRIISMRDTSTALHIRVVVQNASDEDIAVVSGGPPYKFTNDPAESSGLWGSMRIARGSNLLHAGPNVDWWGQSVYTFRARTAEASDYVVTMKSWIKEGWPIEPGQYTVRAWFNGREGENTTFIVEP
jgi:hypothetical protein